MPHETLRKFGYPDTLVRKGEHWALLVRPAQPTLGAMVLCATSEARSYAELPTQAFVEQRELIRLAEAVLARLTQFERINYLMLMMVDPHVHFHVIPRYDGAREFKGRTFRDSGWPGLPELTQTQRADAALITRMREFAAEN